MVHEIILQNSSDTALQILLPETCASSSVCGTHRFSEYTESLSAQDKSKVTYEDCSKPFRFGDGMQFIAFVATIPVNIGPHKVGIKTHIFSTDIPLLLLKSDMKKREMEIKFSNDTINFLGNKISLNTTSSRLYHLPLTPAK